MFSYLGSCLTEQQYANQCKENKKMIMHEHNMFWQHRDTNKANLQISTSYNLHMKEEGNDTGSPLLPFYFLLS